MFPYITVNVHDGSAHHWHGSVMGISGVVSYSERAISYTYIRTDIVNVYANLSRPQKSASLVHAIHAILCVECTLNYTKLGAILKSSSTRFEELLLSHVHTTKMANAIVKSVTRRNFHRLFSSQPKPYAPVLSKGRDRVFVVGVGTTKFQKVLLVVIIICAPRTNL